MPPPAPGTTRVWGTVNADRLRAGRWQDVPDELLDDYRSLAFIAPVDNAGNGPPEHIPQHCCTG